MRVLVVAAASTTLLLGTQAYISHRAIEGAFPPPSPTRRPPATCITSRRSPLPPSALWSLQRSQDPHASSVVQQQTPGLDLRYRAKTVYTRLRSWLKVLRNNSKISVALSVLALGLVLTTGLCGPAWASSAEANASPSIFQLIEKGWTQSVPWCRYKPSPGSFRARVISTLITNFPTWRPLPLVAVLATLPILENKVAIPAGIFMGVPPLKAWAVASASNTAIMPLLALVFRKREREEEEEEPPPSSGMDPEDLKQYITDRLDLLLEDLRDPQEYISPKARHEARSLVSEYMSLAWSLEDKDLTKLENKWTEEFREVDAVKARSWGLLDQGGKENLERRELAELDGVKVELTIGAVALEYAEELEELVEARDKVMARDERLRPPGWKDIVEGIDLSKKLGEVVDKLFTAQSEWAALQNGYRAWRNKNADRREAERIQDEEDMIKGRELEEKAAELSALEEEASSKGVEVSKEESVKLRKELQQFEAHMQRRLDKAENSRYKMAEMNWQISLAAGRKAFRRSTSAALQEFKELMKKAEKGTDLKAQAEKEEVRKLEKLEEKGRRMLEVGWPRVVGNVAFPSPQWGAWTVMYINASNRMKFLPSFWGTSLGLWLSGLAVTMIILTGPLGVLIYSLAVIHKVRTSVFSTPKTASSPDEEPESSKFERLRTYLSQCWKEAWADMNAEDKKFKDNWQ